MIFFIFDAPQTNLTILNSLLSFFVMANFLHSSFPKLKQLSLLREEISRILAMPLLTEYCLFSLTLDFG